ncbi:hypothetical protein PLESTM_001925700 [Pleodorina starrii]|nr:hypothetical protein PLESTM_001925700 [Pleodorina starrii]
MVAVALSRLAEETRCPVCFGILKQTVTSTVCLHRFCASCIEKCLAGRPAQHKDCPVCRANLHSRRALRPDPNFDRLLRALYGDVTVYGQQEDALVAENNRRSLKEQLARTAPALVSDPCGTQRAAANTAELRQQQHRRTSQQQHQPGGGSEGPAAARQRNGNGASDNAAAAGTTAMPGAAASKRPHACESGDMDDASPDGLAARGRHVTKRQRQQPDSTHSAAQSKAAGAEEPALRSPRGVNRMAVERGQATAAAATPATSAAAVVPMSPAAAHHRRSSQRATGVGGGGGLEAASIGHAAAAGSTEVAMSPRQKAEGAAATAASAGPGPRGPLAVPTARSAAELSFRHPSMVVVKLQPGPGSCGGCGEWCGSGGSGTSGRSHPRSVAPPPVLEKPFLLCPAKWTVAHIAQLLSQWLPHSKANGSHSHSGPVPPSAIRLEVAPTSAPGLRQGAGSSPHAHPQPHQQHHRLHLRGCTALGNLAAGAGAGAPGEHCRAQSGEGDKGGGGRRGGGAGRDHSPLVLLYSVEAQQLS